MPVLLEFNLAGESSKHGWYAGEKHTWDDFLVDIETIISLSHVEVRGLMAMPPLFSNPEKSRPYFKRLGELRNYLSVRYPGICWKELSMGTSFDFEVAIEEGATFIRVGQAILGERPKKNGQLGHKTSHHDLVDRP